MSVPPLSKQRLRVSDLSATLKASNGNVTGLADRLVGDGLVERASVDGDRRAMRVRLTNSGIKRFDELAAKNETWVDGSLSAFSAEELETMMALLSRIGEDG